jgi:peptidoglycan/xylan/chitin deacetylase (PgdA/CDA1 family)
VVQRGADLGAGPQRRGLVRRRLIPIGAAILILAALVAIIVSGGNGAVRSAQRRGAPAVARHSRRRPLARWRRAEAAIASEQAIGNARIKRLTRLGLPIYCGARHGHEVAFTFDDGPGVYSALALKRLSAAGERATFFVVGRNIHLYPTLLRRELKLGVIGDHSYTHPVLTQLPPSLVSSELKRTAQAIRANSGVHVDLFRPPYEAHNATVDRIAKRLGLLQILWNVDSADSLGANWAQIIKNVERGLHPGAIILMHENRGQTIRALSALLPALHRRHLRSVTVAQLFASDPPSVAQVRRGPAGCGLAGKSAPGNAA